MFVECEKWVETRTGCYIDPKFFFDHRSTSFASWLGLLNRGSLRAAKPSVCKLILTLASCLQLTRTVWAPGYIIVKLPPASAVLPLIYTSASLDWRLGRGSIHNTLNMNFVICLQGNKRCNNRPTSSTHIDLYDIPRIFYTRIIHTHCLQTLTGYHTHTHTHTYIYIYIYLRWQARVLCCVFVLGFSCSRERCHRGWWRLFNSCLKSLMM